jgi:hypothetical protein
MSFKFWQRLRRRILVHLGVFLLTIALAQALSAHQTTERAASPISPADSVRIVRSVRSAQSSFESFRRGRLPVRDRASGPCDIRVGRYCYWRGDEDDGEDVEAPPEEPGPIRERRDELIRQLDAATESLAGDAWLAGQHVRYLVEAGRTDDALRFAARCKAGTSWCAMLAGYAAHSASRFAVADSAFRSALVLMEPTERCRWLDVSDLLDDELADRFKKTDCDGREAFVRHTFRLGSPMFSISETDLFTEHLARMTRARIAEHAATPDGEPWADDEHELMVRYGWPQWYSRSNLPFGSQAIRSPVTGHDGGMPYDYLPKLHAIEHLDATSDDDWTLDDPRATTGYAPSYARTMHALPNQIATFRRGDSTLVAAAWDARKDTTLLGRDIDAALVLVGVDDTRGIARSSHVRAADRLSVTGVLDSGMVSLELLAPKERRAARAHVGIRARTTSGVALSDILLFVPTDSAANRLDAAMATMLASNVVSGVRRVGAYWELYGVPEESGPVHYVMRVEQFGVGWLQRAKERLHLDDPSTGLRIQWDEVPEKHDGIAGRGVRLDLSNLRPGKYHIELSVTRGGEPPVVSARDVEVR